MAQQQQPSSASSASAVPPLDDGIWTQLSSRMSKMEAAASVRALTHGACIRKFIEAQTALAALPRGVDIDVFTRVSNDLSNAIALWTLSQERVTAAGSGGGKSNKRSTAALLYWQSCIVGTIKKTLLDDAVTERVDAVSRDYNHLVNEIAIGMARISTTNPRQWERATDLWRAYAMAIVRLCEPQRGAGEANGDGDQIRAAIEHVTVELEHLSDVVAASTKSTRRAIVVVEPHYSDYSIAQEIRKRRAIAMGTGPNDDVPLYSIAVHSHHVSKEDSQRIIDLVMKTVPASQRPVTIVALGEYPWLAVGHALGKRTAIVPTLPLDVKGVVVVMPRDNEWREKAHIHPLKQLLLLPSVVQSAIAHARHIEYKNLYLSNPYLIVASTQAEAEEVCSMAKGTEVECVALSVETMDDVVRRIYEFYDRVDDSTVLEY